MTAKINSVLEQVLERAKPSKDELKEIKYELIPFLGKLKSKIKKKGLLADVFVGGSFAKGTLMKKEKYDIDIFVRFDKKHRNENLSDLIGELLKELKNVQRIHGSRDYFNVSIKENLYFEVVPVLKIKKPEDAENITDLSYFHVSYIKKKMKSEKMLADVMIAKAFCHARDCYGAESYVKGFSGYSLELLIYHYGSFVKMLKELSRLQEKKIIDIERAYKTKTELMMNMNSSKLKSPIVLVDPTYKQRNALAALSKETFENFKRDASAFLKTPSIKSFEKEILDIASEKKSAEKKGLEFISMSVKTNRQAGDIAGSKLLKFYNHLSFEISKYFEIRNKGFKYSEGQEAQFFFAVKRKKELVISGPLLKDVANLKKFEEKHKNCFVKKDRVYARQAVSVTFTDFINEWAVSNRSKIKDMSIEGLTV